MATSLPPEVAAPSKCATLPPRAASSIHVTAPLATRLRPYPDESAVREVSKSYFANGFAAPVLDSRCSTPSRAPYVTFGWMFVTARLVTTAMTPPVPVTSASSPPGPVAPISTVLPARSNVPPTSLRSEPTPTRDEKLVNTNCPAGSVTRTSVQKSASCTIGISLPSATWNSRRECSCL